MAYIDITQYNDIVRVYTNKNLLSGRNEVWPYVLNLIHQKPYLGWGGGVDLNDLSPFNLSSHNFYLHTALQVGYSGVFLIFLFYFLLWNKIREISYLSTLDMINANALFIWLTTIQNFEVTLLQNNLAMSIPAICLIGYVMGKSSQIHQIRI